MTMSRGIHVFDPAVQVANAWFGDICNELGTSDQRFVYRVMRTWLHELRDRLDVVHAAAFGAQLPELFRGVFFDGWTPAKVPIRVDAAQYMQRFAAQAHVPLADIPPFTAAVSAAFTKRLAPDFLSEVAASLPHSLRAFVSGSP